MRNVRRRWFAAPLVAIAAPACSSGKTQTPEPPSDPIARAAYVRRDGTACTYSPNQTCPPGVMCNPPPPQPIECPEGMTDDQENARIAYLPDGTCMMIPLQCGDLTCGTPTPCIGGRVPLAPLQWAVNPAPANAGSGSGSGSGAGSAASGSAGSGAAMCTLTPGARTMFDGNGPSLTVECPPELPNHHGFIERKTVSGDCFACEKPPCVDTGAKLTCPK
jgi:hypothetical protein